MISHLPRVYGCERGSKWPWTYLGVFLHFCKMVAHIISHSNIIHNYIIVIFFQNLPNSLSSLFIRLVVEILASVAISRVVDKNHVDITGNSANLKDCEALKTYFHVQNGKKIDEIPT